MKFVVAFVKDICDRVRLEGDDAFETRMIFNEEDVRLVSPLPLFLFPVILHVFSYTLTRMSLPAFLPVSLR